MATYFFALLILLAAHFLAYTGGLASQSATAVTSPVNFESLERLAFVGDFDALSFYQYQGQVDESSTPYSDTEATGLYEGGYALFRQRPTGQLMTVAPTNIVINDACVIEHLDGTIGGIIIAGWFSESDEAASEINIYHFDTTTAESTEVLQSYEGEYGPFLGKPIVLCDKETEMVYIAAASSISEEISVANGTYVTYVSAWPAYSGPVTDLKVVVSGSIHTSLTLLNGNSLFGGQFSGLLDYVHYWDIANPIRHLNGLLEHNCTGPVDSNVSRTPIEQIGMDLDAGAEVLSLLATNSTIYVAGKFSSPVSQNILAIRDEIATAVGDTGLNGPVHTLLSDSDLLYAGGNFSGVGELHYSTASALNNVAVLDVNKNEWAPLGAGVNGVVTNMNKLTVTLIPGGLQTVVVVNGAFDLLLGHGNFGDAPTNGTGVWVPSKQEWLQNLNPVGPVIAGQVVQTLEVPGDGVYVAGTAAVYDFYASGVSFLQSQGRENTFASANTTITFGEGGAVFTGAFATEGGINVTVLGGQFSARLSDGLSAENLVFLNTTSDGKASVSSLRSTPGISVFMQDGATNVSTLVVQDTILYAGGSFDISINDERSQNLLLYDLRSDNYTSQPPPLKGKRVDVNVVSARPNHDEIYIGGQFDGAGDVSCPGLCVWQPSGSQWLAPGSALNGSVSLMIWTDEDSLVVAGDLDVGNGSIPLATYYAPDKKWVAFESFAEPSVTMNEDSISGTITAMTRATSEETGTWTSNSQLNGLWIAGYDYENITFVMNWNGTGWSSLTNNNILAFGEHTHITGIEIMTSYTKHPAHGSLAENQILLLLGLVTIPYVGNVSAALFDGETLKPFILTDHSFTGQSGRINALIRAGTNVSNSKPPDIEGNVVAIGVTVLCVLSAIILIGEVHGRYKSKFSLKSAKPQMSIGMKPLTVAKALEDHKSSDSDSVRPARIGHRAWLNKAKLVIETP